MNITQENIEQLLIRLTEIVQPHLAEPHKTRTMSLVEETIREFCARPDSPAWHPRNMTKTPRTDDNTYGGAGIVGAGYVSADFARTLELELAEANRKLEVAKKALELARDTFRNLHGWYPQSGKELWKAIEPTQGKIASTLATLNQ